MLKIEIVRFEAQDVITASGVVLKTCTERHTGTITVDNAPDGENIMASCSACGNSVVGTNVGIADIPLQK